MVLVLVWKNLVLGLKSGIAHVCCTYLVAAYLVNFLLELLLVLMSCDFDWLFEVRRVLGSEGSREEG